jgi:CDP-diacylglycerol--serine O-phosphatidyltransferase
VTTNPLPKPPKRAAYALPTIFTAGNIFLGFLAIFQTFEAAMKTAAGDASGSINFDNAAKFIGLAVAADGLDGRIARMTNTVSDFGREMDSLADVITFGLAPAVLALVWGVFFVNGDAAPVRQHLLGAGYFLSFLFLLCGSLRLARFNVQSNPVLTNPGRPDRKYFAGLPIPAAAGMVAAVVYAGGFGAITDWYYAAAFLALLGLLSFLMVSTWRYRSFKDLNLLRPRSPLSLLISASIIVLIWLYSRQTLLAIGIMYVGSGIVVRIAGIFKRRMGGAAPQPEGKPIG